MLSRSGKSTSSNYLAFQNKSLNTAQSKVAEIIHRDKVQQINEQEDEGEDEALINDFSQKMNTLNGSQPTPSKPLKKTDPEESGMSRAQKLNEQRMEARKQTLEIEMKKISNSIAEQKLTKSQQIKRMLKQQGGKSKITEKDVQQKMLEENKKNCSSFFNCTSREQHQYIFRNKTQPPDIGKYNPRMESVDKKTKIAQIPSEPKYAEEAKRKKLDLDF